MDRHRIAQEFRTIQQEIRLALEQLDGKSRFVEDPWTREGGGGGLSLAIADGSLIEKGGVNFSEVFGALSPEAAKSLGITGTEFFATGVSIVLHAVNPWVPTIHMNIRYFEVDEDTRWFGGGIDLTPVYVDEAAARHFHKRLKEVCDRWDASFYPEFKRWADEYFFLPHRNETRGVGGIFFDRLSPSADRSVDVLFGFTCDLGRLFASVYAEAAAPHRDLAFTERERTWQLIRRGRYVEFNLAYDRGTRFGLLTGGRTESILMSLPADARWIYGHTPEPGSPEAATLGWLRQGIEWA